MRAFLSPMKEMPVPTNHLRGPDFSQMDTSATSLPGLSRIEPITAGPEKLGLPQVQLRVSQFNVYRREVALVFTRVRLRLFGRLLDGGSGSSWVCGHARHRRPLQLERGHAENIGLQDTNGTFYELVRDVDRDARKL